jgi:hypothetical protein
MNTETAAVLARITTAIDALHFTESKLRTQRAVLRDAALAIRTGEAPAIVVARLRHAKAWAPGDLSTELSHGWKA